MVNATEMATNYGKEPYEFLRLEQTKRFIAAMEADFKTGDGPVLNAGIALSENEEASPTETPMLEMVRTKRGRDDSGATWMHRVLALKFAGWLDARFEVWVYQTIEQALFAHGQRIGEEIREKARLLDRRDEIRAELQGNALFQEHQMLEFKLRQISTRVSKHNTSQLGLFRQPA